MLWNARVSQWQCRGDLGRLEQHTIGNSGVLARQLVQDGFGQLMASGYSAGATVYSSTLLRDKVGRVVSVNRVFSEPGQPDDKAWRGYKYQQSGALER